MAQPLALVAPLQAVVVQPAAAPVVANDAQKKCNWNCCRNASIWDGAYGAGEAITLSGLIAGLAVASNPVAITSGIALTLFTTLHVKFRRDQSYVVIGQNIARAKNLQHVGQQQIQVESVQEKQLRGELTTAQGENARLTALVDNLQKQIPQVQQAVQDSAANEHQSAATIQSLQQTNGAFSAQLDRLESVLKIAQQNLTTFNTANIAFKQNLTQMGTNVTNLNSADARLTQAANELGGRFQPLVTALSQQIALSQSLFKEILAALTQEHARFQAQIDTFSSLLTQLQSSNADATQHTAQMQQMQQEAQAASERIAALNQSFAQLDSRLTAQLPAWQQTQVAFTRTVSNLGRDDQTLSSDVQTLSDLTQRFESAANSINASSNNLAAALHGPGDKPI